MPLALDSCVPINPVVSGTTCVTNGEVSCDTGIIPIKKCGPDPNNPTAEIKCVNDIVRRPWPTPPPAEIGCNPLTVNIENTVPDEDDPDQTMRLEGSVGYISGDACLPKVNLKLVAPPSILIGGGSPNVYGSGYNLNGICHPVGPTSQAEFKTPQQFLGNERNAHLFTPTSNFQEAQSRCQDSCDRRSRYGASAARFNIIGPFLASITSRQAIGQTTIPYTNENGESVTEVVVFAWRYGFNAEQCVIAGNACQYPCAPTNSWAQYPSDLEYMLAFNIKENLENPYSSGDKIYGVGVNLSDMLSKGYRPQPIMLGAMVMVYGYISWGTSIEYQSSGSGTTSEADPTTCDCPVVWFIDEQNAFDGQCRESETSDAVQALSNLPQRNVTSAGMFFGVNDNANRV